MVNYSIIIPHHNSSPLLLRCLKAIPVRLDLQVIVVDDNSKDFDVAYFTKKFPTVKFIETKEGKGAGYARNVGLKKAEGKWILFSDADDFFNEGFLEHTDKYLDSDYDIIFFDIASFDSETLEPCESRNKTVSPAIKEGDIESLQWRVMVCWSKMFNREFIEKNNISFDEVMSSNDVMFSYKCAANAKKVTIDNFVLYCNTVNRSSLCYRLTKANIECRYDVRLRANRYLYEIGKEQYQGNLFNLVLYYQKIGFIDFVKKFGCYIKDSSLKMMLRDFRITFHKSIDVLKTGKTGFSKQKVVK